MFKISMIFMFIFLSCYTQNKNNIITLDNELIIELENMFNKDQKIRVLLSSDILSLNENDIDSLWGLQKELDKKNTERLIKIISDHGFIHSSKTNCQVPVYSILMHSPLKYKDTIIKIINEAKSNNRIDSASYGLIKWHINGRPELIFNPN